MKNCSIYLQSIILQSVILQSSSLIPPPFEHTLGYYRVTPLEVKLVLGKTIEFNEPYGITCAKLKSTDDPKTYVDDDELTVFCTNSWQHQIVYNQGLKSVKTYGSIGNGKEKFFYPYGITCHPNGYIYVADCGNHRIVQLRAEAKNYEIDTLIWVKTLGEFGCAEGSFDSPYDVAIDTKANLYVADYGNNRVQIFDSLGNFIKKLENFNHPIAVAVVDSEEKWSQYKENFIIVIDNNGTRIQKITSPLITNQTSHTTVVEFQDIGLKDAKWTNCAIDYYNNIWVTDEKNGCIHKFDHLLRYITQVKRDEINIPRAITIWRRYGQVFILEPTAINYFWIGVDGYIEGCYPKVFNPKEKGTTITIFLTEPAYVSANIYNEKKEIIRNFLPTYQTEPFTHNIVWDGRDNQNNIVQKGEYYIEIKIEPTYSAKGYFSKKLETKVICE